MPRLFMIRRNLNETHSSSSNSNSNPNPNSNSNSNSVDSRISMSAIRTAMNAGEPLRRLVNSVNPMPRQQRSTLNGGRQSLSSSRPAGSILRR